MAFINSMSSALALAGGLFLAQPALAAPAAAPVSVATLMTKAMADHPGKEILVITVDFAPGAVDPVHRHDAHAVVYVLEGSIVMGVKGGKEQVVNTGQTFYEGPQDLHTVGRNASKTKPAKFLVFLVKDAGKPFFIPVK
ncbi:cupin domain-containing protein [Massilia sp. ST3]|uniref:cupin domain-containing protein n=1 Tax=Massilia sp. ST3 TaxID=2824903 RepID=UPI001B845C43|nr:cupin domain-containing protein [Massilia sp. ST3]MBQ5950352.1 cupin domain-containing protein [Massilia sp. ST3]